MVGSNPMTSVLIRRGEYHVTTEEGHMTPEAGVGVTPRMDSHHQKLEEALKDSSLEPSATAWPCCHLDSGLPGSRTVGEYISIPLSHPACGLLFSSPQTLVHI